MQLPEARAQAGACEYPVARKGPHNACSQPALLRHSRGSGPPQQPWLGAHPPVHHTAGQTEQQHAAQRSCVALTCTPLPSEDDSTQWVCRVAQLCVHLS